MDFELSDEQLALRDSTRRLLSVEGGLNATRSLREAGVGFDEKLWRKGCELGWAALAVPEEHGGLGQSIGDWVLTAVEHGRALLPSPFLTVCVVADALGAAVPSALLEGTASASWAFAEPGRSWSADAMRTSATAVDNGFVLNGTKAHVQDASTATWLLVDAVLDDAPARFLVERASPGVSVVAQQGLDVTREHCDVVLDEVRVPREALLVRGDDARAAIARSVALAAVLASGELVGAGEQLLAMTVEYAKIRVQFDKPIGSFQAVKHKCADMRMRVQAATAATLYASMALEEKTPDALRASSIAKAYASDAIPQVAGDALQTHGGIGFTWEHDLHLYLRRAHVNALLYGDVTHHRELLCRSLEKHGAGPVTHVAS